MRRPPFPPPPQEDSWYSFLVEAESTKDHSAAGRIRSIKKIHLIGTQTRDLPASSIVEMGEEDGQNQSATDFYGGTR
jgi:hypothetical protein